MSKKPRQLDPDQMRDTILRALEDAKAVDVKVLDVRQLTDITDYMIVSTGNSDRHVKSQTNRVLEHMHQAGCAHLGIEGEQSKDWVLVDFVDIVVHIMRETTRKRYDLEGLWDKSFGEMLADSSAREAMKNNNGAG